MDCLARSPCISSTTFVLFGLFLFFFSAGLIGRADFVVHDLPFRSAVAREAIVQQSRPIPPRASVHPHNEHPEVG
jgi:hypothetical protein